ncbi:MAG: NDP-sugar synthase [Candidatus Schekmanbacteria bacterium]|nr:NDP-sugar synthase [Candidatus Schekmanbacteria bacterium]
MMTDAAPGARDSSPEQGIVRMAFVLCAGFGTRLRPLTTVLPKPLVPILDRPLLEYTFAYLRRWGVREVVINAHHLAETLRRWLARRSDDDLIVECSVEPTILGTAGGLRAVRRHFEDEPVFLMVNGDVLTDVDLSAPLALHQGAGRAATLVVTPRRLPGAGLVGGDGGGRLTRLAGYLPDEENAQTAFAGTFAGIHVLSPRIFSVLGPDTFDINRQAYPALLASGAGVGACCCAGYWSDLGTPPALLEANLDVLSGAGPRLPLRAGETLDAAAGVFVGADARVAAGAALGPGVVLGAGAQVGSGARLARAVVMPGASVPAGATVCDGIVMENGAVLAASAPPGQGR